MTHEEFIAHVEGLGWHTWKPQMGSVEDRTWVSPEPQRSGSDAYQFLVGLPNFDHPHYLVIYTSLHLPATRITNPADIIPAIVQYQLTSTFNNQELLWP